MRARAGLVTVTALALIAALPASVAGGSAQAAEHVVVIEAMAFTPGVLKVEPGDTVVWVNRDFFPHTATASDGGFDSGNLAAGASWRHVVERQGAFGYVCTLHPTMKGVLIVE